MDAPISLFVIVAIVFVLVVLLLWRYWQSGRFRNPLIESQHQQDFSFCKSKLYRKEEK